MRIISKFKDYYDKAMGFGIDTSVLYLRNKKYLCGEDYCDKRGVPEEYKILVPNIKLPPYTSRKQSISFASVQIYFCGKIHTGIQVEVEEPQGIYLTKKTIHKKTLYKVEEFYGFLSEHNYLEVQDAHLLRFNTDPKFLERPSVKKNVEDYFSGQGLYFGDFIKERIKDRTISALARVDRNEYNNVTFTVIEDPKLEDYDFFRVFPAPQAYQEIEMFISGVLGAPNKEPLPISDKDRIQQHGFDKRSFRKDAKPGRGVFRTSQGKDDS